MSELRAHPNNRGKVFYQSHVEGAWEAIICPTGKHWRWISTISDSTDRPYEREWREIGVTSGTVWRRDKVSEDGWEEDVTLDRLFSGELRYDCGC